MDAFLSVRDVKKGFQSRGSLMDELRRRPRPSTMALDGVSLDVGRREIVGLVGESGSGKTTLARCLVRLVEPDAGSATFDGQDVFGATSAELRGIRRRMQLIYQDPYSSLNPLISVGSAISEPARVHGIVADRSAAGALVTELLDAVGLAESDAHRRPRELSGGQRQRVAIARALAVSPDLLIADEAVSALDVSVQAQILNLFADLAEHRHLAMIFVSHQLAVIAQLAARVAIMYRGRIVEIGPTAEVFTAPQHPYTSLLLEAHPDIDHPKARGQRAPQSDAPPPPSAEPVGCRFRTRCPLAQPVCETVDPPAIELSPDHRAWCHVVPAQTLAGREGATTSRSPQGRGGAGT